MSIHRNAMDTYANSEKPARNFAGSTRIVVRGGTDPVYGYIYFAAPPKGVTILSATLRLWMVNPGGGSKTVTLKRITESWKGGRLNYNNRPTTTIGGQIDLTQAAGTSDHQPWAFDVQDALQSVSDGNSKWWGYQISIDDTTARRFYSAQAAQYKPELEYTYTTRPDTPTDLRPDGGVAIATDLPLFRWNFMDSNGSRRQGAYQLRIGSRNDREMAIFDTGIVYAPETEFDPETYTSTRNESVSKTSGSNILTSTTNIFTSSDVGATLSGGAGIPLGTTIDSVVNPKKALMSANATTTSTVTVSITQQFQGFPPGDMVYWWVRVMDEAGEWSKWSDEANYVYEGLGTLTIDNPPVGGLIEERTPPIFWTYTGTQVARQVIISNSNGRWLYDTGMEKTTETSWTVPPENRGGRPIISNVDDETYTVTVKVRDDLVRGDNPKPGAKAHVQASREMVFNRDATIDPVENLTVDELPNIPGVRLTFQRDTAPDHFVVDRKVGSGRWETIRPEVDPADVLISGTTYRINILRVPPRVPIQYRVEAALDVGGDPYGRKKTSSANPIATYTTYPVGIWLADGDRQIYVRLLDQDEGSWAMGEDAETHVPVGADKAVRITQGLRGYEGSVTGRILDLDDGWRTVEQQERDIFKLKQTPGKSYDLTLSNIAIPVVIGNVLVQPTPMKELEKFVSFEFWQVGDLHFDARI